MDLLDFTKVSFEKQFDKVQEVNLEEIASLAIVTASPYAIQKDVHFETVIKNCKKIWADPNDIEIIFNNLISNAVKYNKTGGKVTVTVDCNENELLLSFEDTGIGMSTEDRETIFNEFSRIKNEKTKNISGSGLGLSIVKKVVELYHGVINVESTIDKGSIFTVIIPLPQVQK
jgi:two-component system, sensor histidine kinase and response regulator